MDKPELTREELITDPHKVEKYNLVEDVCGVKPGPPPNYSLDEVIFELEIKGRRVT